MLNFKYPFLVVLTFSLLMGCTSEKNAEQTIEEEKNALFVERKDAGIQFTNTVENRPNFNIFNYRNFYNGGGVAIADINNDGLSDVYFTANMGENKLFLNKGNFQFEDITASSGTGGKRAWSTGVVMVDVNNDKLLDIYVCNAGNVEGDDQRNELFINNGDLTFTEQAAKYGLDENGFTTHAAFFDYDLDGDLDVYILNNSFIPVNSLGYDNKRELRAEQWNINPLYKRGGDKLLRNDNGVFVDVSEKAGIYGSLIGFGLGVTVGDVNHDFLPDIYVSNDFYERDYLYINQGDGTFSEEVKDWIEHMSMSSMGADMADINNDGYPEIFVTDMLPEGDNRLKTTSEFDRYDVYLLKIRQDFHHQFMQNTLQLNNKDNTFSEISFNAGVAQTDWSWGALIFDMDNDGYKDIYVSNGINNDLTNLDFIDFLANDVIRNMTLEQIERDDAKVIEKMPSVPQVNYVFHNNKNLGFANVAKDWGMQAPSFSNGAAYGDLDNDGDLDLIVNNVNQEAFVFENRSNQLLSNNYIAVKLIGDEVNPFGVGSSAEVFFDDQILRQELIPSRGFQSSVDYRMVFGLGKVEKIDSIRIISPKGKELVLKETGINQLLEVDLSEATKKAEGRKIEFDKMFFSEVSLPIDAHKEDNYVDFDYEGLVPKMISREGPTVSVGDVNGDGIEDLFIGGARGQKAQIILQTKDNQFNSNSQNIFDQHAFFEDTASAFFDADGDGDLDLYVGSGGNQVLESQENFKDRLYLNDGKGNFSFALTALETSKLNTSLVIPYDFDQDGDEDLFVAMRSIPGLYGVDPENLLLENDGRGNFTNVIESKAHDLRKVGMITAAEWVDMNKDDIKDLVLTGDWMAPKIFENNGKRLKSVESNLSGLTGMWSAMEVADVDGDGDLDIILGNNGTNWYLKTSEKAPIKMYINDFDKNGTIEQILTRNIAGKDKPIPLRRDLAGQIPSLKKTILKFEDYAEKSIQELFPADVINNSVVKSVANFESGIAYNEGNFKFTFKPLPQRAQNACVNAILVDDLDKDGISDLIMAGNDFSYRTQYSRSDASHGDVFMGLPNREYVWKPNYETGLTTKGQVNSMVWVKGADGKKLLLLGRNNESYKLFQVNE